ncbi:CFI-box-CTERM domain-containing protein [Chloroflexota bacterium]
MKRFIFNLILITVLVSTIMPSFALAAEESQLTDEEKAFVSGMASHIARARSIVADGRAIAGVPEFFSANDPNLPNKFFFLGCRFYDVIPSEFEDIGAIWYAEVCDQFAYMYEKATALNKPLKDEGDVAELWLGLAALNQTLKEIDASLSKIEGMTAQRVSELEEQRNIEDEAKKELGLGDDFCFIATAAYGTPAAAEIDILRQFRDDFLKDSQFGNWFIGFYYRNSPPIADFIAENELLRTVVRDYLVAPAVRVTELTQNLWQE